MYHLIKSIWFLSHNIGMHIVPFLWFWKYKVLYFHLLILASWKLNQNRCIVSQTEYYLWGETFMGNGPRYYVPEKHRIILLYNFVIGSLYYFYKFSLKYPIIL